MLASEFPAWFVRIFAFLFGTLWGSFFNVCIYRWPREMSVVSPPSHCPSCGAPIDPWRNVPVFGYLFLRGKAACCGARMSPRYLVVELLGGLLCVATFERWLVQANAERLAVDGAVEALLYFAFAGGLLIATFVDLEWMEIPDEVSLPGAALGLMTVTLREAPGAEEAALGAGLGFLLVQVLFVWGYEYLMGRRGMGEGDSKLLLFIGAFVGWKGAVFSIVAGSVQGLLAAGITLAAGKPLAPTRPDAIATPAVEEDGSESDVAADTDADADAATESDDELDDGRLRMPFGPFLALGALEFLFFGDRFVAWYTGLIGY